MNRSFNEYNKDRLQFNDYGNNAVVSNHEIDLCDPFISKLVEKSGELGFKLDIIKEVLSLFPANTPSSENEFFEKLINHASEIDLKKTDITKNPTNLINESKLFNEQLLKDLITNQSGGLENENAFNYYSQEFAELNMNDKNMKQKLSTMKNKKSNIPTNVFEEPQIKSFFDLNINTSITSDSNEKTQLKRQVTYLTTNKINSLRPIVIDGDDVGTW
jgi:hypothetical protein